MIVSAEAAWLIKNLEMASLADVVVAGTTEDFKRVRDI